MIKNIVFICLTIFSFYLPSQNFVATYGFPDVSTSSGVSDPSATPSVTGLEFGAFSAVGVSSNPGASGRFSFTNWSLGGVNGTDDYTTFTGAMSPMKFYKVTIAVVPGYTLNLNSVTFGVRRSGTGIRNYCVRSDLDNYNNNLAASTGTNTKLSVLPGDVFFWNYDSVSTSSDQKGSTITLNNAFSAVTNSVTFHFYAWNSEANGGSFSIDNVSFIGSVTDTLIIENPVGVKKLMSGAEMKLFPNPCNDGLINIQNTSGISKVEVISLLGSVLVSQENLSQSDKMQMDLSTLAKGIYFVKTYSAEKSTLTRIILTDN